jgi:2,3-bisphosphoglycerate-independent phosphoglycerate mutase
MSTKKVLLVIMDGWGLGQVPSADAIAQANTPFVDGLYAQYPHATLVTHSEQVGLPDGQMGNSEVGHLNIGAGRVVYQELARINKAVREHELNHNPVLLDAIKYAKDNGKPLHIMGLVSDGGVHSHINHLKGLIDIVEEQGLTEAYIHAFTDGRDCDPKSGLGFLQEIVEYTANKATKLASVVGRYYAMDRDKRWERVKLAYDAMVNGIGEASTDVLATFKARYDAGETDEFIKPIICTDTNGVAVAKIKDGDALLCFNFRTDRPREISQVLTQMDIPDFGMHKLNLHYTTMTTYDETYQNVSVLFENDNLVNTLGEVLSKAGKTQVRIAETEKYPHVTFFFNGGREEVFPGERRLLVPSPKVATYDLQPEMSAQGITDAIVSDIVENQPDFICLNYANADMVGHTGVFSAAIKAVETVDHCMNKLINSALDYDYDCIIIADHGNADYMINEDGTPNTAHTKNPVPIIYASAQAAGATVKDGKLGDIAPTILSLMGVPVSPEMTGSVLIGR